jgi:hypothetical protein
MENIQKKLDELYLSYLSNVLDNREVVEAIQNQEISSPLFIDVNAPQSNYINRPFKVLYVGQENNGWFNLNQRKKVGLEKISDLNKYLIELKSLYFEFNIGEQYNKPIFIFLDILIESIQNYKQGEESTGFLWTNLIRHSGKFNEGKIPDKFEDKLMYDNNFIFRKEMEILDPNAVIFVTGPNYDKFLKNTFNGISFISVKNYDINEIAVLKHANLPKYSCRVYHPNFHNRLGGAEYMKELSQDIIDCFRN